MKTFVEILEEGYDDNRKGFARKQREDDEYHTPDPVTRTHKIAFNVSKDGAEKHSRTVTISNSTKSREEAHSAAKAHLQKQGYKIHESADEKCPSCGKNPCWCDDSHGFVSEEVINEDSYEKAEKSKHNAELAKGQARPFDHHMHMADHHDYMSQWHDSKGRHSEAAKHAQKSDEHHEKAMAIKEEVQIDEAMIGSWTSLKNKNGNVIHVKSNTDSKKRHTFDVHINKNHPPIEKNKLNKKTISQRHASGEFDTFFKEEAELDEAVGHTIEAHGIRGMKGTPWRKTFKSHDHLNDWAEKNDSVEVHGTRELEGSKKKTNEEVELDEVRMTAAMKLQKAFQREQEKRESEKKAGEEFMKKKTNEEVESVEEGLKPEHKMRPGWMLKADPKLAKKVEDNKKKYKEFKKLVGTKKD